MQWLLLSGEYLQVAGFLLGATLATLTSVLLVLVVRR